MTRSANNCVEGMDTPLSDAEIEAILLADDLPAEQPLQSFGMIQSPEKGGWLARGLFALVTLLVLLVNWPKS